MLYQNAADNYVSNSTVNNPVVQRVDPPAAKQPPKEETVDEAAQRSSAKNAVKQTATLSAALLLDLMGGCGLFTGSVLAYTTIIAGSIEAADAAGEGLDYDEALMNIATASVSAYVGTATGADKEKIQLIYGAITSFTISVFKDFQLELKRVYNENKSLNDINMTEVFAKATGRAAMDDATSYGTTLLENKCNDSGSASAEFLEAFTAWADATGQDVADIYYEDSKNHKKNQAGGGDQPNETPKTQ